MSRNKKFRHVDPVALARRAMLENEFRPDMDPVALRLAQSYEKGQLKVPESGGDISDIADLRKLLWSSIDNADSKDLDQIEYAERLPGNRIRLMVAIADVDWIVPNGSESDTYAGANTTSVYTGVITYPMLPEPYSHNLTSLLPGEDRLAIIMEMVIDVNGRTMSKKFYRGRVCNKAKLVYSRIGNWLEGGPLPHEVESVPGLEQQLRLQHELSKRLEQFSHANGALDFNTIEARTVVFEGRVVDLQLVEECAARDLIRYFMITANNAMAEFLESKRVPFLRRIVKTPEKWSRIVEIAHSLGAELPDEPNPHALNEFLKARKAVDAERFHDLSIAVVKLLGKGEYVVHQFGEENAGHFGLGLQDYTHFTAPNRRYIDLVMQRILKSVILGEAQPYTPEELAKIAAVVMQREHGARKIERYMRKVAAALLLANRIGEVFPAIVTGVNDNGVFVRTITPPAEGRLMNGQRNLGVADQIKVRLVKADPVRGYIDFEQVGRPTRKWKK